MNSQDYINSLYGKEDSILTDIRTQIQQQDFPINIRIEEARLIQIILQISKVQKMVEIGTHFAYSTIYFARILARNGGKLYSIERDKKRAAAARHNIKAAEVDEIVELLEMDAMHALTELAREAPYEAIFIDANKNQYLEYLAWSEKHLKKNGIIIADNTLLKGNVYQEKINITASTVANMREFNRRLADQDRYLSIMLPASDGLTIAIKLY